MEYKYLCTLSELRRTIRRANEKIVICWFSYDDYDVRPHYRTYVRDKTSEDGDKKFNSYPDLNKPYDENDEPICIATGIYPDEIVASILLLCYEIASSGDITIHIDDNTIYGILEEDYHEFKETVFEGLVSYLGEFS